MNRVFLSELMEMADTDQDNKLGFNEFVTLAVGKWTYADDVF